MKTRMVAQPEWRSFFRDVSRIHDGALITISVAAPGVRPQKEDLIQSLRGISETRDDVFVHTGNPPARPHLARCVRNVNAVLLRQTDEGADAEIDIDFFDGSRTIVRFRSPALPELLDPGVE